MCKVAQGEERKRRQECTEGVKTPGDSSPHSLSERSRRDTSRKGQDRADYTWVLRTLDQILEIVL